ncbi:MAG TPA: hypothetical protein VKA53_05225 [Thermoanaerobaculia bacterium]|nr:hypothetical protein [Thermoanaerobaculia bacterium]
MPEVRHNALVLRVYRGLWDLYLQPLAARSDFFFGNDDCHEFLFALRETMID